MMFLAGFPINGALLGFAPPYRDLLAMLGVETLVPVLASYPTNDYLVYLLPLGTVASSCALLVAGVLLLYLSTRFDFVEPQDDPLLNSGVFIGGAVLLIPFFVLALVIIALLEPVRTSTDQPGERPDPFYILLMLIPMLIHLITGKLFVLLATSVFVGGLLTVPRTAATLARRHKLTAAWSRGLTGGEIDGRAVIAALGNRTETSAEARKLHRDARQLLADVEAKVGELRRVRDDLKRTVMSDADVDAAERRAADVISSLRPFKLRATRRNG